MTVVKILQYFL